MKTPNNLSRTASPKKRNKLVPARLAGKLRQIRLNHNLTQAKMLVIVNPLETADNRARVSQYEKGTRIPSLVEIYNYAKFAGVAIEYLVNDDLDLPR
jgi:transcriptional regulator with XRE-family HTH domain